MIFNHKSIGTNSDTQPLDQTAVHIFAFVFIKQYSASSPYNELPVCSVRDHLSSRSLNQGTDTAHNRRMHLMHHKAVAAWPVSDTRNHEQRALLFKQYACCTDKYGRCLYHSHSLLNFFPLLNLMYHGVT